MLQISFDNAQVSKVKLGYHLYCKQFEEDKYEHLCEGSWFPFSGAALGNHDSVLKLDDCKQFEMLEFCCDIKILEIVLKET